jgi:hypothetical protein
MLVGTRRTIALILSLHQGLLGLALSLHHLEKQFTLRVTYFA